MPGTGYQHMVHDYYIERLRATYAERKAALRALRTRAQARREIRGGSSRHHPRLRTSPAQNTAQCSLQRHD